MEEAFSPHISQSGKKTLFGKDSQQQKNAGTINTYQQAIMAPKNEEFSVVTYNYHGLAASLHEIEQLCALYHNFSPISLAG